jgi:hypothetical protein
MPNKNKTKSWFSQNSIWAVIIFSMVIIIFGLIFGKLMPVPVPGTSEGASLSGEQAMAIKADDLLAAYIRDEAAADAAYKGKLLDVAGVVKGIGVDATGYPFISLESKSAVGNVRCILKWDLTVISMATELLTGDIVVLQGRLKGHSTNVVVDDCAVIRILRELGKNEVSEPGAP